MKELGRNSEGIQTKELTSLLFCLFSELGVVQYDSSKMVVESNPTGGLCAFDLSASCSPVWNVNIAEPWINIDLGFLYYITSVYINVTNGASWNDVTIKTKRHKDQSENTIEQKMVRTQFEVNCNLIANNCM